MNDYLKLLRIPNVFTAVADILMGFAFTQSMGEHTHALYVLIPSSCCLYMAGMILNDVFDYDVDRLERPRRPLPSGRIRRKHAAMMGAGLLAAGIVFGWGTGLLGGLKVVPSWRPGLIATLLAAMVLLYDGGLKKTSLGPLAMGSCRFLNVLLGMSVDPRLTTTLSFSSSQWIVAGGMGTYVTGITLFARHEATTSPRGKLITAWLVMVTGVIMLAMFPFVGDVTTRLTADPIWPVLLLLLTVPIWRRCLTAIGQPTPANVQSAVKHAIMTLILLNAALSMSVAGAWYGGAVACLLIPSMILGRWIYST